MAARRAEAVQDSIVIDDDSTASELDLQPLEQPVGRTASKRPRPRSEERFAAGEDEEEDDVGVKVEWTDESDGAYERLKKRKRTSSGRGSGRGRGRGATEGSKKRADARGGSRTTTKTTATARSGATRGESSRVSFGTSGRQHRPVRKSRVVNNGTEDSASNSGLKEDGEDDDDNDVEGPEYVRQRRREFESKLAILKDAGLCLPPDYTDIYFSDDDDVGRHRRRQQHQQQQQQHHRRDRDIPDASTLLLGRGGSAGSRRAAESAPSSASALQQRPQFDSRIRPSREYKDVVLQYSAGIIPACIAQYLRDYQIAGVQFLHRLFVYQRGGILGDDMGLGKTVQVAAFLTAAFGKTGDERDAKRMRKMRRAPAAVVDGRTGGGVVVGGGRSGGTDPRDGRWYPVVLVVCPGSLLQNWRNELQRWGWWHVDVYHGAGKDDVLQAARAGRLEIMITTYATYKNHRERINAVRWDAVVADECHVLKERTSETTQAMNAVNALCRIGLTGTAIQNRYEELWTLLNWTNPGRFGTMAEWRQTISRPLTIGQSHDATLYQLSLARRTAKKLVQNLLPDYFLRRMKSLIAHQLPRKTDRVVFCPLTARQSQAYENFINSEQVELLRRATEPCDCGSGSKRGWCCYRYLSDGVTHWFALVFPTIQNLLKLSNHLMLLVPSSADSGAGFDPSASPAVPAADQTAATPAAITAGAAVAERHERAMNVLRLCVPDDWAALYRHRDSLVYLADPAFCGKWKVLRKLLRFWHANGDKVLVFSHTVRLLRILQHLFHNTSYSVSYLDGSLSYDERQRVVDDFNADPAQFVFLISTKAGGVGLNITSANKVVIFDPHWNPAYDLQAQDRAYRIGQVRDVDVFRLVSAGTIEEIVYARQVYKQQQANIGYSASTERRYFRGVQQDSERKGEIFGLENLFTFHTDQVVLRDIVNKTNIAEAKAGVRLTTIDMERAAADDETKVLVKLEGAASQTTGAGGTTGKSGGNGDAVLSQLAASLEADDEDTKPDASAMRAATRPESNVIQAILASAGVEYTHDNSEVVGSSRIEAQLSRQAELVLREEDENENDNDEDDGDTLDLDGAPPVDGRPQTTVPDHNHDLDVLLADTSAAFVSAGTELPGRQPGYRYNPPADVMRRQFCTMARDAGFATATDFALVVESWTPEQRRQCLEGFYRKRTARLQEQAEEQEDTEDDVAVKPEKMEEGTDKPVVSAVKTEDEEGVAAAHAASPASPPRINREGSDRSSHQTAPSVRIKAEPDDEPRLPSEAHSDAGATAPADETQQPDSRASPATPATEIKQEASGDDGPMVVISLPSSPAPVADADLADCLETTAELKDNGRLHPQSVTVQDSEDETDETDEL
ncbi:DNA excision repair protein [Niveomyces insectorum RCEF 264]|uniref:DNA excision repair protein n=1 Tax=Niveomyces insectorum RCEF 264 TaxID=1081102 RepID=A0A167RYZ0_9HYPO|nr:DNA excision repair protein [Niveomyces insectorum RCEF 264]